MHIKQRLAGFILLLTLTTSVLSGYESKQTLKDPIKKALTYDNHVYGLTQSGKLIKIDEKGFTKWEYKTDQSEIIDIKFNQIFLKTKDQFLESIETEIGQKKWTTSVQITGKPAINYPYIISINSNNHLEASDFFTGSKLWNIESPPVTQILYNPFNGELLAANKKNVYRLSDSSEQPTLTTIKTKSPVEKISLGWQGAYIIKSKKAWEALLSDNNTLKPLQVTPNFPGEKASNSEYIQFNPNARLITKIDLKNNTPNWELSVSDNETLVYTNSQLISYTDTQLKLRSLTDGNVTTTLNITSPISSVLAILTTPKTVLIIEPQAIRTLRIRKNNSSKKTPPKRKKKPPITRRGYENTTRY